MKSICVILVGCIVCVSCNSSSMSKKDAKEVHDAIVKNYDGSEIHIDRVPNKMVMKDTPDTGQSIFYSFRVGFVDSTIKEKKAEIEMQKYFDYEMHDNWRMMEAGDSIRPVFFQPMPRKNIFLREGIIVFEIPRGTVIDTLVYRDKYRPNVNVIVFNTK